jgi:hypothetical protein
MTPATGTPRRFSTGTLAAQKTKLHSSKSSLAAGLWLKSGFLFG